MSKSHSAPVVLGMHADNALNVYVRAGDQIHQAARIVTVNGMDPAAMVTVMADLAETFRWHQIAVDPPLEVPPSRSGLPRAGVETSTPASTSRGRRSAEQMQRQRQIILDIVSRLSEDDAMAAGQIAKIAMHRLGITVGGLDGSTREDLIKLAEQGLIRRIPVVMSNHQPGSKWCGLGPAL